MKPKYTLTQVILFVVSFLWLNTSAIAQPITSVTGFGSNPGALNMYNYVPAGISGKAPLVVALHGCTENATTFAQQSGWNKLALLHGFYMVYPEQTSANNSETCFNWFDTTQIERNKGEALSVIQMVTYMKAHYAIDTTQIYVTGLSAGGAMTAVMMATYPDVFISGAVMAGVPYWAATNATNALYIMDGFMVNTYTPAQWAQLVKKQFPGYKGKYPRLAVFQGTADAVVDTDNTTQLIDQWTELNHANQSIDSTYNSFQGNANIQLTIFNDSSSRAAVYHYKITGMGHGIAVDTGSCPTQGGATNTYAIEEKKFHSTYWAAQFFNLIPGPYSITGNITVSSCASGVVYSVTNTTGSTYQWTVPPGCTIVSGQGTNSITVNFSTHSGYVQVAETDKAGCELDPAKLYVTVSGTTGINTIENNTGSIYYNAMENSIVLQNINPADVKSVRMINVLGQVINETGTPNDNKVMLTNKPIAGIYIITVYTSKQQFVKKIAIQ
ncbi:MAG TPA: PHB depolymerase family esterase [Bacteroidia bacterium]|jgi:poly(hydroxyalkanoate) depolymerase family esterase|nr:PHB depolymerase family esterase [Bacteroidia bacterium]